MNPHAAPRVIPGSTALADAALRCTVAAFAADPLMRFLFGAPSAARDARLATFFSLLLQARLATQQPVLVLDRGGEVGGLAMGYAPHPPPWPAGIDASWQAFEQSVPGLAERFDAYEAIVALHRPAQPHHYLGVLAAHPPRTGGGRLLLDAFCTLAERHAASAGVYLETASAASLAFYRACGFDVLGEGRLDGMTLWCVFKPARRA